MKIWRRALNFLLLNFGLIHCMVSFHYENSLEKTKRKGQPDCFIHQEKVGDKVPPVPEFLKNPKEIHSCTTKYRKSSDGTKNLRCQNSNTYILPKCICGFHQVMEAKYHEITACNSAATDNINNLKCSDCKKFSQGNDGPCVNDGQLKCKNDNDPAFAFQCLCPEGYSGDYCETKIDNVSRLCWKIDEKEANKLTKCEDTSRRCATQNGQQTMWFECEESYGQRRQELPSCLSITKATTVPPETTTETSENTPNSSDTSRPSLSMVLLVTNCFFVILQKCFTLYI